MTLPTYEEALAKAREGSPFSNSTEGECWMENNCEQCVHDRPARTGNPADGCPLVLVAYLDKTPAEWMRNEGFRLGDQYTCVMFRPEDDPGPDEPTPAPDPPGQLTLCPREPYERPGRMYVDIRPVEAGVR
ncbi:hypothetical protein AB0395_47065 [Streptosporangium sp. NPDC051023]|uniref:hypothetical protein n=1 Tax=Streptosporangium sp. NPDC051023 TaxID=3155410 RepID=UPI00344B5E18